MKITLYSLTDYNNGTLIAETFDLEKLDKDQYYEEVANWLADVSFKLGDAKNREEWIVADYEDIPEELVDTWNLTSEFWEYLDLVKKEYMDRDAIDAAVDIGIPIESIEDSYQGEFDNDKDFAYMMYESMGYIDESNQMLPYIDWDMVARDLMFDYLTSNGHYFTNDY